MLENGPPPADDMRRAMQNREGLKGRGRAQPPERIIASSACIDNIMWG